MQLGAARCSCGARAVQLGLARLPGALDTLGDFSAAAGIRSSAQAYMHAGAQSTLLQWFTRFDRGAKGCLDTADVGRMMAALDFEADTEYIDKLVSLVGDEDGRIPSAQVDQLFALLGTPTAAPPDADSTPLVETQPGSPPRSATPPPREQARQRQPSQTIDQGVVTEGSPSAVLPAGRDASRTKVATRPEFSAKQKQEAQLRKLFRSMDTDGGGTLDRKEVQRLAILMGDKLTSRQLKGAFKEMLAFRNTGGLKPQSGRVQSAVEEGVVQYDGKGRLWTPGSRKGATQKEADEAVTFDQFTKWWHRRAEDERRDARTRARELFDAIDIDKGGTLDATEMAQMAKLLQQQFPRIHLHPAFDLAVEFKDMDVDGRGVVTFEQFDAWWKKRSGDDAPTIPILPESMVRMINTTVEGTLRLPKLPEDRTDPKVFWDFLRPRLMQLVQMEKSWGDIQ